MKSALAIFGCAFGLTFAPHLAGATPPVASVLRAGDFEHYVGSFNADDEEVYGGTIRNTNAWAFLSDNIPLFECPDKTLEEIYYFRWWSYRKHLRQTPDGFVVTEFLPDVPWAGKYNTINCAAGHHFYEGRWLRDPRYLDEYATFWLRKGGGVRVYSFWIADSLWNRYLVTGLAGEIKELFPDLVANYRGWEKDNLGPDGLFWQIDGRDGMEMPIGDNNDKPGYRPTINTYMFADARAIAKIAELVGNEGVAEEFRGKAARLKQLVQEGLWDKSAGFFKFLPVRPDAKLSAGRELFGYTPWYANLPDPGYEVAWKQIMDTNGFYAPYGLTTAERRCSDFRLSYQGHECQWNGPSWPYSTAVTLTSMANLLNNYQQSVIGKQDYFEVLSAYAKSQHLKRESGVVVPWIDEDLNPLTGDWIARTIMRGKGKEIYERGKDYNHSTFCDLIVNGLVGLRPRADDTIEVNPLVPEGRWNYFCLDAVLYHGHILTIFYDKTGTRYHRGAGLRVLADGVGVAVAPGLSRMTGALPKRP